MDWRSRVSVNPEIMHGRACIKGTRIPVTVILDNLANGASPEEIRSEYPTLEEPDIAAVLAYAAELARERVLRIPA